MRKAQMTETIRMLRPEFLRDESVVERDEREPNLTMNSVTHHHINGNRFGEEPKFLSHGFGLKGTNRWRAATSNQNDWTQQ